jgi:hypothetical protein
VYEKRTRHIFSTAYLSATLGLSRQKPSVGYGTVIGRCQWVTHQHSSRGGATSFHGRCISTRWPGKLCEQDLIGFGDEASTVYTLYRVGAVHRVRIAQHPPPGAFKFGRPPPPRIGTRPHAALSSPSATRGAPSLP